MCFFCSNNNGPFFPTRLVIPQEKRKHTGSTTPTEAFALASTSGSPRDGRALAGLPLSAPMPTHPRRHPRSKRPRVAPLQTPHYSDPPVFCCCYCCCCFAVSAEVNLARAVVATAAVLLLRLVEYRAIFLHTKQRETTILKSLSKYQHLKNQFGVFQVNCSSQGGGTQSLAKWSQLSDI